jgi:hypothetical protein
MNPDSTHHDGTTLADVAYEGSWGVYGAAIEHHAEVLGRPAPAPTDEQGRLSPAFVEWMMMLPEGWVTDVDISRTAQLKLLGNAVVPAQAAAAWGSLLGDGFATHTHTHRRVPTPRTSDSNGSGTHGDGGADLRTVIRCL